LVRDKTTADIICILVSSAKDDLAHCLASVRLHAGSTLSNASIGNDHRVGTL